MSELKRGLFPRRRRRRSRSVDPNHSPEETDDAVVGSDSQTASTTNRSTKNSSSQNSKRTLTKSKKNRAGKRRKKKNRPRRLTLAVLPTMLTLGNAVCGLAAIAVVISSPESLNWQPESKLFVAGLLIYGGMLFDALDGSAARLTGQASEFGAELDSLCDAVTFGTAPAVIIWQLSDVLPQRLTWGIGVLFTLCVLIRLARFNVETGQDDPHDGFEGLPSPAAAGTVAAFAIAVPELKSVAIDSMYPDQIRSLADHCVWASHYVIPILALVLAYLMVSRFQYPHVFQQWVQGRRALHQIGQALFVLFGVILLDWLTLPLVFSYFAFASPARSIIKSAGRKYSKNKKTNNDKQPSGKQTSDKQPSGKQPSGQQTSAASQSNGQSDRSAQPSSDHQPPSDADAAADANTDASPQTPATDS